MPGNCRYFFVIGFTFFREIDIWRNSYHLWLFLVLRSAQIKKFHFLGAIFLVFLMYSPHLPSTSQHFCHYCSRFAAGRIKNSLFREFPQIISHRVCRALSELCPVSEKTKSHVYPINTMKARITGPITGALQHCFLMTSRCL